MQILKNESNHHQNGSAYDRIETCGTKSKLDGYMSVVLVLLCHKKSPVVVVLICHMKCPFLCRI